VAGNSAAVALLGFEGALAMTRFSPLAKTSACRSPAQQGELRARVAHDDRAYPVPAKKQAFFWLARVGSAIDRMLVYSTSEERLAIDKLGLSRPRSSASIITPTSSFSPAPSLARPSPT